MLEFNIATGPGGSIVRCDSAEASIAKEKAIKTT